MAFTVEEDRGFTGIPDPEPDRGYTGVEYVPGAPVVIPKTIKVTGKKARMTVEPDRGSTVSPYIPPPEPDRGGKTGVPYVPPAGVVLKAGALPIGPVVAGLGELFPSLAPLAGVVTAVAGGEFFSDLLTGGAGDMGNGAVATVGTLVDNVPISGPGVPEPPRQMVAKQWKIKVFSNAHGEYWMYFFRLIDGRIMCYHPYSGWKIWRPKKPLAVMYRGRTTLSQAIKVQKYLDALWHTVARKTKALKLA